MKDIEKILQEINDKRFCGVIITGIASCGNQSHVGKVAAFFRLVDADDVYEEVSSE